MTGGQVVLTVFLSLLALLVLLSFFPVKLKIHWASEQGSVTLLWLFFRFRLFLRDKKKGGKAPSSGEPEKPAGETSSRQRDPFIDRVQQLLSAVGAAGRLLRLLLSLLRVKADLQVTVGGEDAAEIALRCGQLSAYFHSAAAVLANFLTLRQHHIIVLPDYDAEKTVYTLNATASFLPITVLFSLHRLLPDLQTLADAFPDKKKKTEKGAKKHE